MESSNTFTGGAAEASASDSAVLSAGENTNAADSAEGAATSESDRAELYKKFRSDYKQEIDAELQSVIRSRLKSAADFKGRVTPLVTAVANRLGCDPDDLDAVASALANDDSLLRREASRDSKAETSGSAELGKIRQKIRGEVQAVKQFYSGFNLAEELKNPEFASLIKANVPMQTAYEVVHKDVLIPAAIQAAARKTAEHIRSTVAANRLRPAENGMSGTAPALSSMDVGALTREQMGELKARAARGERVKL